MNADRCELSDLPADQCACLVHAPKPDPMETRDYVITARFFARFNSYCDECDSPMREGEPIARTDQGEYICLGCAA